MTRFLTISALALTGSLGLGDMAWAGGKQHCRSGGCRTSCYRGGSCRQTHYPYQPQTYTYEDPPESGEPDGAENSGLGEADEVVWDLPANPKGQPQQVAPRPAAGLPPMPYAGNSRRPAVPLAAEEQPAELPRVTPRSVAAKEDRNAGTRPAAAPPVPAAPSWNQRVVQAVAIQQVLAAQNARLEKKRAELTRWDVTAQENFHRAFGTTDDKVRERVLQRINQQIQRNVQLLAEIGEGMNFDFYLQSKKAQ